MATLGGLLAILNGYWAWPVQLAVVAAPLADAALYAPAVRRMLMDGRTSLATSVVVFVMFLQVVRLMLVPYLLGRAIGMVNARLKAGT